MDRIQVDGVEIACGHGLKKALGDRLALRCFLKPLHPECPTCCGERQIPVDSSNRDRSFRRGTAAAVPNPAEDVGATPLGRPSLALKHLKHGDLFSRQRIALDRLHMRSLLEQAVCDNRRGGNRIMLLPEHGGTQSCSLGEGDQDYRPCRAVLIDDVRTAASRPGRIPGVRVLPQRARCISFKVWMPFRRSLTRFTVRSPI